MLLSICYQEWNPIKSFLFDFYGFFILIFHEFCVLDVLLIIYYYVNPSQVMDSMRIEIQTKKGFDNGPIGAIHPKAAKHSNSNFNLLFLDGEETVLGTI